MTRLLEEAFSTVAALPGARQDELAPVMLRLAGVDQPLLELTPDAALLGDSARAAKGDDG